MNSFAPPSLSWDLFLPRILSELGRCFTDSFGEEGCEVLGGIESAFGGDTGDVLPVGNQKFFGCVKLEFDQVIGRRITCERLDFVVE